MNPTILAQLELAQRACQRLTGAGIEIRRVYVSASQGHPAIVCVPAEATDHDQQYCEGCRLVWRADDDEALTLYASLDEPLSPGTLPCGYCGCTELSACQHDDGSPCFWISPGLCSVCAETVGVDVETHRNLGAEADVAAAIAMSPPGGLPR